MPMQPRPIDPTSSPCPSRRVCNVPFVISHPFFRLFIGGDFAVEDAKAGFEIGHMGPDTLTMLPKHLATLAERCFPATGKLCIKQHVADRHSGRLQTAEKLDPGKD